MTDDAGCDMVRGVGRERDVCIPARLMCTAGRPACRMCGEVSLL